MTNIFNDDEQDAISRAGSPSSWSLHPCDPDDWSNDEGVYDQMKDEKGNILVPCRPGTGTDTNSNGQRPISEVEHEESTYDDGEGPTDDKDTGEFILDGRPDGFRPGADIVSKASTSDPDTAGAALGGSRAPVGVIIGALTALVAAAIFLVARKRSRKAGNSSDQITLIHKGAGANASSDDDDALNTTVIDNSFEQCDFDGDACPIDVDDADAILSDIEASFGGHHIASSAMVGAMMATTAAVSAIDDNDARNTKKNNSSSNNNIELDPEAAAAYIAGGSVAAAAVTAERRARNADVEAQQDDGADTVQGSYLSANSRDLGRRHSSLHVTECRSGACPGCRSLDTSLSVGEVSFVAATKVDHEADDMTLAGGAKAWLADKVELI